MESKVGKKLKIHAYKHNGELYKAWSAATLLYEDDEVIIVGNDHSRVEEADGRVWYTGEEAIVYFYKKKWYSVVSQLKEIGITYYCDISSPAIIEDNIIKYVDYDLDLRVYTTGRIKVLDKNEYAYHKKKYNYPEELDHIIKDGLEELKNIVKNKQGPFDRKELEKYINLYKNTKKQE